MIAAILCGVILSFTLPTQAKPLKVYILAGQSNMEGHAQVSTFDYIGKDPKTAPMLKEMRNADGSPKVCDNVYISYYTGGKQMGEGFGKLTAGYGSRSNPKQNGGKIGPEFTFGIYTQKLVNEPILIIKTAWGGKSINTDFRPPSAGPYPFSDEQLEQMKKRGKDIAKEKAEKAKATGHFYRLMMNHVKTVLKDIKRVYPAYDENAGYELAGFAWFQGWNDMVDSGTYSKGGDGNRYAAYSDVLAHFIRDVRKDLSAPDMRFVIGVMGVGGPGTQEDFRAAMAAPASMPEFKGNVVAVQTAPFWDFEIPKVQPKQNEYRNIIDTAHTLTKDGVIDTAWGWDSSWKPLGKITSADRTWRYRTIAVTEDKDKIKEYTGRRFRDITLPGALKNWTAPDFDDSAWSEGKAPIGKGSWKHRGKTVKNNSAWGDEEFLVMRTTFKVDDLNYDSYRLSVLARQGFHVYLNGHKIHTYIWWKDHPYYRSILLGDNETKHLKIGTNVLAAYANDQYSPKSSERYASIDLAIEGITKAGKAELERKLEAEVLSAEDRETLKGASNAGYHYLGSAKIMGQIGKAFAEAMVQE
jgi:alpha-galactosidase